MPGTHRATRDNRRLSAAGLIFAAAATLLMMAWAIFPSSALAVDPPGTIGDPDHPVDKVTICHRNSDAKQPYVVNEPDADGDVSGHDDHDGPLAGSVQEAEALKDQHIDWGDIIPPFYFDDNNDGDGNDPGESYPGKNWPEGQAIWDAGCNAPECPNNSTTTVAVTTTRPTTTTATHTTTVTVTTTTFTTTTATDTVTADILAGANDDGLLTVVENPCVTTVTTTTRPVTTTHTTTTATTTVPSTSTIITTETTTVPLCPTGTATVTETTEAPPVTETETTTETVTVTADTLAGDSVFA